MDLSSRSLLPEKMDQPGIPEKEIHQALNELETINKLLGGYNVIIDALNKLQLKKDLISIADLGCGGGDLLRVVAVWARKKNIKIKLTGVDRNPVMTTFAADKAKSFPEIQFKTLSIFDDELLNDKTDITMNTLFCHHFTNEEIKVLLKRMMLISDVAVIINDLHRHWFAYHSIKWITRLFSKTFLVRYDAPLSVARALSRDEWEEILNDVAPGKYSLRWMWAWRWQIIIRK